jgi:cell fate (sporulation/competence/biofilm development) regulator YlbF (YheA/YmcA/DUF963 family)
MEEQEQVNNASDNNVEERILEEADRLGRMLGETEEFRSFEEAQKELEEYPSVKEMLESYSERIQDVKERQTRGDRVEPEEYEQLRLLSESISGDPVASNFIKRREEYIALLESIQKALQDEEI